jgi:hypothetical protein
MTERELTRLLDQAVPPIPPNLLEAPYTSIRQRARQRRAVTAAACASVVVAVCIVVAGIVVAPWRGEAPTTPAAPIMPGSTTQAVRPPARSVLEARVDRAGTGLTLYVNPDQANCVTYPHLTPVVDQRSDRVVVTFTGAGTKTACDQVQAAPITVTLSQPLGDRALLDGSGTPIRPFFDADLPALPAGWTSIPGQYEDVDGTVFVLAYQAIGTGILIFNASTQPPPYPADLGEVTLGSRTGSLFTTGSTGDVPGVRWQVRDLTYQMTLEPSRGSPATLDHLRALIDEFSWP